MVDFNVGTGFKQNQLLQQQNKKKLEEAKEAEELQKKSELGKLQTKMASTGAKSAIHFPETRSNTKTINGHVADSIQCTPDTDINAYKEAVRNEVLKGIREALLKEAPPKTLVESSVVINVTPSGTVSGGKINVNYTIDYKATYLDPLQNGDKYVDQSGSIWTYGDDGWQQTGSVNQSDFPTSFPDGRKTVTSSMNRKRALGTGVPNEQSEKNKLAQEMRRDIEAQYSRFPNYSIDSIEINTNMYRENGIWYVEGEATYTASFDASRAVKEGDTTEIGGVTFQYRNGVWTPKTQVQNDYEYNTNRELIGADPLDMLAKQNKDLSGIKLPNM